MNSGQIPFVLQCSSEKRLKHARDWEEPHEDSVQGPKGVLGGQQAAGEELAHRNVN